MRVQGDIGRYLPIALARRTLNLGVVDSTWVGERSQSRPVHRKDLLVRFVLRQVTTELWSDSLKVILLLRSPPFSPRYAQSR